MVADGGILSEMALVRVQRAPGFHFCMYPLQAGLEPMLLSSLSDNGMLEHLIQVDHTIGKFQRNDVPIFMFIHICNPAPSKLLKGAALLLSLPN